MAEVVDAIIADLIVRNLDKYEADFNRATAAHDRFFASTGKLKTQTFDLAAEGQKYKQGAGLIAGAEEQLTQRVTQTRKARTTNAAAEDAKVTASAKKAAKEQADAAIAEAQREAAAVARIRAMVDKSTTSGGVRRGSGRIASTSVPGERTGQGAIPLSVLNGGNEAVAAETEVNHLLADQAKLQAALTFANKEDAAVIRDKLAEMRLINQLQKAGLGDAEIAIALEKRALAVEVERATVAAGKGRKAIAKDAEQFARGSGLYAATGGGAAIAGIATAASLGAIVAVTKEVVTNGLAYAETLKQESAQLGISAHALQIWQIAAADAGVKTEQLKEGLGQLASNLGKAQEGSQQQAKIFKGMKIDIGNAKDGYKSLNDILPVFMDKLSKIPDQARRLAVETALGGEQLRKLDPILSKGSGSFDEMSRAIEGTGMALSNREIQRAAETAEHLRRLNDQLQRQLAGFVAANATAIDQLAASFFRLASSAVSALAALQRFGAMRVIKSDMASPQDAAAARDLLNSTREGRAANRTQLNEAATGLDAIKNNPSLQGAATVVVRGIGSFPNTPQGRNQARAAIRAEQAKIAAAEKDTPETPTAPGGPDLSKLFAGPGKHGPKDKTNEQAKRFADELARLQDEQLRAQADTTQDELARLEIKQQQLKTDTDRQKTDIELQVKEKQLTRAQADALEKQLNDTYNAQLQPILRDKTLEAMRRTYDAAIAELNAQEDILRDRESLAKTVAERAALEKQILDIERQKETLGANYTIDRAANDDSSVSTSDLKAANRTLKTQDNRFAQRSATIDQQNRGPLGDYLASLPNTMAQVDEAMQKAAANGLQALDDGLTSAVAKFLHLHGIAGQFLQDLIKIGIERELLIPLANTLFPQQGASAGLGGSGGGLGGLLGSIAHLFGGGGGGLGGVNGTGVIMENPFTTPGFATGVTGVFGGRHGTDNNILSLNGQPFARVNRGEPFAIGPNIGAANGRVSSPSSPNIVVVQPIHADFTGARTDEQTMRQFQQYADARSRQAYEAAVATAGQQAPGVISRAQTLKG
jgi:hypothetical protein